MERKLYPYFYTHNTYSEGGRKTHIRADDGRAALCGFQPFLGNMPGLRLRGQGEEVPDYITEEWLRQADPDGEVCSKCRKAANKIMNIQ